jgi:ABC-type sulfate transport system substrate-binding protein
MTKWLFKDGASVTECDSFPYAYRLMYNTFRKGLEKNARQVADMVKQMSIVSPAKDAYGNLRKYSYATATQMAKDQGLLTAEGQINSREFCFVLV